MLLAINYYDFVLRVGDSDKWGKKNPNILLHCSLTELLIQDTVKFHSCQGTLPFFFLIIRNALENKYMPQNNMTLVFPTVNIILHSVGVMKLRGKYISF